VFHNLAISLWSSKSVLSVSIDFGGQVVCADGGDHEDMMSTLVKWPSPPTKSALQKWRVEEKEAPRTEKTNHLSPELRPKFTQP